jgi:hypothetical protein
MLRRALGKLKPLEPVAHGLAALERSTSTSA